MKRAAPNSFADMLTALNAMSAEVAARCVQAAPDQVLMWQGRARQIAELADQLRDCIATAEKLEAKTKERR